MLSFVKTRAKTITKFIALPYTVYILVKHFDDFEELLISFLISETRKIVKRELKQPFLIEVGSKSLKNVLISTVLESPHSHKQTALLISRLLKHKESEKFGVFVANNLLNKKHLKQMALDIIRSYQTYYKFELVIPDDLN